LSFFYKSAEISFSLRPIHGLIFLFKWVQDDELSGNIVQDSRLDKIFFAKQVKYKKVILNRYADKCKLKK